MSSFRLRNLGALAAVWLACVAAGMGLLVLSFCLGGEQYEHNSRRALMQVDTETYALHMLPSGHRAYPLDLDRLSDHIMIAAAAPKPDSLSAIEAAAMSWTRCVIFMYPSTTPQLSADTFYLEVDVAYARYWHGYLVWLRPLLLITDARGVFAVVAAVFWLLVAGLAWAMWRRKLKVELAALVITALPFTPWIIPQCLIFSLSWIIALIACIVILAIPAATSTPLRAAALMTATGCAVAFSELLATPLVAFTLPMIMLGLARPQYRSCRKVAALAAVWIVAYGLMWMAKWVFTAAATDYNIFADVWISAMRRTGGVNELQGTLAGLSRAASQYAPMLIGAAVLVIALVGAVVARHRRDAALRSGAWLLCVAAAQLVWMAALFNHTVLHYWFTYRALAPVTFALALYFLHLIFPRLWPER